MAQWRKKYYYSMSKERGRGEREREGLTTEWKNGAREGYGREKGV